MKDLELYIDKHGYHFTDSLVNDVVLHKWDFDKIKRSIQKRVYYNVTGSTFGDMLYLIDLRYNEGYKLSECIKYSIDITGDYFRRGYAFRMFILGLDYDIDFSIYK